MSESMKGMVRSHRCTEVSGNEIGQRVTVMGWVQNRRNLGSLIFISLRDRSGILQVVFNDQMVSKELFDKAYTLRNEFVIAVTGTIAKREAVNPNMKTGDIELNAEDLRILAESETVPFPIEENSNTKEDLRLKYRYLDLRRPDLQRNLMIRHRVTTLTRQFLSDEGFLEIETPILAKSTPEGARDYLVPSRIHPGNFYALPQSPQTFKQLLMLSGYDRYFQIAKCFRDEDLRADRQPEFTQIDMELSFINEADIMDINERLIATLFKDILNVDIELPLKRMTYKEAMERYGSDKPDIRFGMEIQNVSELVKDCGFGVFTSAITEGGSVRCVVLDTCGNFPRKQIDSLVDVAKLFGAKGMPYMSINEDGSVKSSFSKFMTEEENKRIIEAVGAKKGDLIVFAADKDSITLSALGNIRLEVANRLGLLKKDDYKFLWVTEFPLLEWDEEEKRFVAMHHPFTMAMDEDLEYLDTDPGRVRAKAYDMVLNGTELGGGSIRIYQRDIQEKMFLALGFTLEEAYDKFGFLLNAFKYGVPPHGGLAFGLDRIIMLMTGSDSIRDVIAFPKVKDASCPMTDAPGEVEVKQLQELGIAVVETDNK